MRRARLLAVLVVGGLLLESGLAAVLVPLLHAQAAETTRTGLFTTLYSDPPEPSLPGHRTIYRLSEDSGATSELRVSEDQIEAAGGAFALERQRVTVVAEATIGAQSADAPLFVKSLNRDRTSTPQDTTGSRAFLTVLCRYAGAATEPRALSYFTSLMSGANGVGMDAYWREVSYNAINLAGSAVVGWGAMAHDRNYYLTNYGTNWGAPVGGVYGLDVIATDCMQSVASGVNPSNYQGINLIFNDELEGGVAWGGSGHFSLNGTYYSKAMTWLPPWGYSSAGPYVGGTSVMSHEMGHAFGFRHSANPAGQTYYNSWDVMSGATDNCDLPGVSVASYGCLGQHIIGYNRGQAGWLPANRRFTFDAVANVTRAFTLTPIEEGSGGGYLMGVVPRTVGTRQTTIELRRRVLRDVKLPGDAVIIHDVQPNRSNSDSPAWVQGTDGSSGAMFTQGESYAVPGTVLTVQVASFSPTVARIVVTNGLNPVAVGLSVSNGRNGTPFLITGTNLSPEATVTFNGTPAASVSGSTGLALTVTTPTLSNGTYPVVVTNPDGRTAAVGVFTVVNIDNAPVARPVGANVGVPVPALPRAADPLPAAMPTPRPAPASR